MLDMKPVSQRSDILYEVGSTGPVPSACSGPFLPIPGTIFYHPGTEAFEAIPPI